MSQNEQQAEASKTLESRITTDPAMCGGRPCIRGLRIRVSDVLDLLASGLSSQQVSRSARPALPRMT